MDDDREESRRGGSESLKKYLKEISRLPRITAEEERVLVVGRAIVPHAHHHLIEQTREPYPLHAYDKTSVTIMTAFYPRMPAGFPAGI